MSNLIKNYKCKDVQNWKIVDIFDIRGGYTPSKRNLDFWSNGTLPWFRMDDIRKNGRILSNSLKKITFKAAKDNPFKCNSIILSTTATIGEHALIKVPFVANQRFSIFTLKEKNINFINIKYLYYHFFQIGDWCKKNTKVSSFPSVDINKIKEISIPIPPIKEQQRIVKILDKFTELAAELAAELTASIKQYEYYRSSLFRFPDPTKANLMKIKNLIKISRGERITKRDLVENGKFNAISGGVTPFGKINSKNREANQITIAQYGSAGYITWQSEDFYANDVCYTFEHDLNILNHKYLYYFLMSKQNLINSLVNKSATPFHLPKEKLQNIKIPIPPIKEQEKIVKILDKFELLTSNLKEGLPREIELREKQYKYFRNMLLRFRGIE